MVQKAISCSIPEGPKGVQIAKSTETSTKNKTQQEKSMGPADLISHLDTLPRTSIATKPLPTTTRKRFSHDIKEGRLMKAQQML
jgi:hypothetical protein